MKDFAPEIRSGLESRVIGVLRNMINEMPPRTATLTLSRVPGRPELPEPYFEVSPDNPAAGIISGVVRERDGVELTLGRGGMRELFASGGTIFRGMDCVEEFQKICEAVIHDGFTERAVHNRQGKFIYAEATVIVMGQSILFGSGRWLPLPFLGWKAEQVKYAPYL